LAADHHLGYRCGPFPHLPSDPLNDRIFDASIFHHWTAAYCLCLLHRTGTRPRRWPYLDLNLSVVNMRQYRRRLHHGSRFSAAISNASIATSHAVVSCSDLGSVKYAVWRPPAFAASCHRARQPADRGACPKTRCNSATEPWIQEKEAGIRSGGALSHGPKPSPLSDSMTPALFVEFGFEALRRPRFGIIVIAPWTRAPAPSQVQACSPWKGLSGWASQTQPQSSHTAHFIRLTLASGGPSDGLYDLD
jgi:hypothetical protein